MRRRLLRSIAMLAFRRAWLVLPILAALTAGSVWTLDALNFDTSLGQFLPLDSPEARTIREIVGDYRRLEPILVVVRSRTPEGETDLKEITDRFAWLVNDPRYFSAAVYKTDELAQQYYESLSDQRLMALLTPGDWTRLRHQLSRPAAEGELQRLRARRLGLFSAGILGGEDPADRLGVMAAIRRRLATSRGPTRLDVHEGSFMTPARDAAFILLYPAFTPENGRKTLRTVRYLEANRKFLFERNPEWAKRFEITFLGSHIRTAEYLRAMEHDLVRILMISGPLALMLILLVFRKAEAIVFILVPPLVGLLWSIGGCYLAWGGLTTVASLFLVLNAGIGLNYSVHLYHRFTLELYRHHHYYRALSQAFVETGRGLLASAMVGAVLYFLLLLAPLREFQGWRELLQALRHPQGFAQAGLIAGLGLLITLLACLLTVPSLAAVKSLLARGRVRPVALYRFRIERLYEPAIATPRATLGVMLLVCVFFGYHARALDYYPRFAQLSPLLFWGDESHAPSDGARAREAAATRELGVVPPGRPMVAVVDGATLQEALERNDLLYERLEAMRAEGGYNLLALDSLRTILPSVRSQRESMAELARLDLRPIRAGLGEAARRAGLKPSVVEPFLADFERLQAEAARPQWFEISAAEGLVQRYVTRKEDGRYHVATMIYPGANGFDPASLQAIRARLTREVGPLHLIGDPIVERELSRRLKHNLAILVLLSLVTVYVGLVLHFRSARRALLTLAPAGAALVWMLGAIVLLGIRFHFYTMLALPLMLSLAMDNALQLTQYYYDRQPCRVRHVMLSLGRVAVLTCGLSALLYGTLGLVGFSGLREFGGTLVIGSLLVLPSIVMLLPALLELFGRGQPVLSLLTIEGDGDS